MKTNRIIWSAIVTLLIFSFACHTNPPPPGVQTQTSTTSGAQSQRATTAQSDEPGPLPDKGFKAEITLLDPPVKLRAGQKETIRVKIKNASDVMWWARGGRANKRPDNTF